MISARRAQPAGEAHDPEAPAGVSASALRRWLVACVAAAVVLSPLAVFSFRQKAQLNWVRPPNMQTLFGLLQDFAGVTLLMPVVGALVVLGCLAAPGLRRGRGLTLALVCLPWFLLPPSLLLSISLVHPVYVDRYILFSLPALVMLAAAGLVWLASLMRRWIAGRMPERRAWVLSAVPSAALAVLIGVMVIGPQAALRLPNSRADDLRTISRIIATHEQPGDAVLYLPRLTAVISRAYPEPFNKLKDIDMLSGPIPSGTLLGVPASPEVVAKRLKGVSRVWTVEWVHPLAPDSAPPTDLVRLLAPMRMVGSWLVQSVLLVLYAAPTR